MSEAAAVETTEEGEREGARTVRLRISAAAEHAALPRLVLGGVALMTELTDEGVAELRVALTEAVARVARGANGRPVEIAYELAGGELCIDVSAEGGGRERLGSPRRAASDGSPGDGLPVPIVTAVPDDLEPEREPVAAGSRLRFLKRPRTGG